jgi:hypothetical protein
VVVAAVETGLLLQARLLILPLLILLLLILLLLLLLPPLLLLLSLLLLLLGGVILAAAVEAELVALIEVVLLFMLELNAKSLAFSSSSLVAFILFHDKSIQLLALGMERLRVLVEVGHGEVDEECTVDRATYF